MRDKTNWILISQKKKAAQIMSILQGKYIIYGKLINLLEVLNEQKFPFKKKNPLLTQRSN